MKNLLFFIIGLSLLFYCITGLSIGATDNQTGVQSNGSAANTIQLMSSPELTSLTENWANEYGMVNPSVKIITGTTGDDQGRVDLSFSSNDYAEAETEGQGWRMVVGRDAIVAVINANNPNLAEINRQGLSYEEFALIFKRSDMRNWKNLIVGGQDAPFSCYMIDNAKVNASIGGFTNIDNAALNSKIVATSTEIISAIQKDKYAIGFCKLTDVRDATTNEIVQGIQLLPIDKNGNGRIDSFESIYTNLDAFTRGVWIGKYPHALCGSIYAVSSTKPDDKATIAFLSWVTTEGQIYLNKNGYSDLASREVKSNMKALTGTEVTVAYDNDKSFFSSIWMIILIILGIVALIAAPVVIYARGHKLVNFSEDVELTSGLNEDTILAPKGLYFDKSHTWAFMEKDGNVKVGLDDFLQHVTGTLSRITMKGTGEKVRKGEKILTIVRNGKQLNIYAPISGIIMEQNKSLLSEASLINSAPFTEGWVYLIEPKNWAREIQFLFMGEQYKEWLSDEFTRLKDFFAHSVRSNTEVYAHIILQDGGELTDNVLAEMGPEVWEDFQTKFIDTSK